MNTSPNATNFPLLAERATAINGGDSSGCDADSAQPASGPPFHCLGCGDPCAGDACERCRAWDAMFRALAYGAAGVDVHRLRRALAIINPAPDPVAVLLRKLARRIAAIEESAS